MVLESQSQMNYNNYNESQQLQLPWKANHNELQQIQLLRRTNHNESQQLQLPWRANHNELQQVQLLQRITTSTIALESQSQ
jgi:hypothetical protein